MSTATTAGTRRGLALALGLLLATAGLLGGATQVRAETDPAGATAAALRVAPATLVEDRRTDIAPGLTLTSFRRLQPGGWVTGHVMDADLTTPSLSLDVTDGGEVSGSNATVEEFARNADAVAAINGDYFDMNASDAPIGTNVSPNEGLRTAGGGPRQAFTIRDGKAAVQSLMSGATVEAGGETSEIGSVNSPSFAGDSLAAFTPIWGTYPIGRLVGESEPVRIVMISGGRVSANTTDRGAIASGDAVPDDGAVLVGRGRAADRLAGLAVGTEAKLTIRASEDVDLAVGGSQRLLTDGRVTEDNEVTAARTAIGVNRDGTAIKVITVDGRSADAHGMTIQELARFMSDLGMWNAVNLDGGGSTTLVARPAGTDDLQVINRPSDGKQRADSNALVFRSAARGSSPTGRVLRPELEPAAGLPEPAAHGVLPGLSRTLIGTGLDANLAATPAGRPVIRARAGLVRVEDTERSGPYDRTVVRGNRPGTTTVIYGAGRDATSAELRVFGDLQRIEASATLVPLGSAADTSAVRVTGIDADGNRVPVENRDIEVAASDGLTVERDGLAELVIGAREGAQSGTVTIAVRGKETTLGVTVGHDDREVADFADPADWKVGTARATGSLGSATGPEGGPALALDFDFTTSTATRGMYAVPVTPIELPGQPRSVSLWIKGTGKGEWPRLQVTRGDQTSTNLDGALIDWTGWRKVTFPVPAGTAYPLQLTAIRFMETRSNASYRDRLEIADLRAQVPQSIDLPEPAPARDPAIISQGTVDDRPLRIAVISDAQFVARNPDSDLVQAARRTLREIVAAKPDFVIIAGDLVDEAAPEDIALARRVLEEELGDLDHVYVPGNHEIMGGSIDNFRAEFGDTATERVLQRTKIITLDSSTGNLHPGGSTDQLRMLEAGLADAERDPGITGVLVANHHPVDDPQPDAASQLGDRVEADALARTLADFTRRSGKQVAQLNGHVGIFDASALDGVTRVINGNSGKGPSGTPDAGGFTGWTMIGIDPGAAGRTDWLRAETRARVDELALDAPATLARGETAEVKAVITQDGSRKVPVAWPVSATWGGTGVAVGSKPRNAVITIDPLTGRITAVRAGTATLTVTVNGATAQRQIRVG
ncbi:phosphodiester glycosidase family protein [Naumannella huperziae]